MFKVRVKEFFEDMIYLDGNLYHDPDGMRLEEYMNKFLEENPNIFIKDIKYWVKEHKDGEDESQVLLIYEVIEPYILSESEFNEEFGIEGE